MKPPTISLIVSVVKISVTGILLQATPLLFSASVVRDYDPSTATLTLTVIPDAGTAVYAVEEQLAPGLAARMVSESGAFDPYLRKLKWGPFFDDLQRELTCELVTISEQEVSFEGSASWDGSPVQPASGDVSGSVSPSGFYSWVLENLGASAFFESASDPANDNDADQFDLLEEYVFGMNPESPDEAVFALRYQPDLSQFSLAMNKRAEIPEVELSFWQSSDATLWSEFDPGFVIFSEDLGNGMEAVRYAWPGSGRVELVRVRMNLNEDL